jgi:hypothetical protein
MRSDLILMSPCDHDRGVGVVVRVCGVRVVRVEDLRLKGEAGDVESVAMGYRSSYSVACKCRWVLVGH